MKLAQLMCSFERTVLLEAVGQVQIEEGRSVRLQLTVAGITVSTPGYAGACELPAGDDRDWLGAAVARGAYVAELLTCSPRVALRVLCYDQTDVWSSPREIGVDDLALEHAKRLSSRISSVADAVSWLASDLVLDGPEPCLVLSVGGSTVGNDQAFRLIGASLVVDVRLTQDRLLAHRLTRRVVSPQGRLHLVRGECRFVDALRASSLPYPELVELRRLAASDNAYLEIWREYNQLERAAAVNAAKDIGWAEYDQCWQRADGRWEFVLVQSHRADAFRKRLGTDSVGLEAGETIAFDGTVETHRSDTEIVIGEAIQSETGTIVLRADSDVDAKRVPQCGYVTGAYTLDKARLDRRDTAQQTISRADTFPVQQLTRILSDQPPSPPGRHQRHQPISARVLGILGGEPTAAQREAIDVAINSQDLALIQGPPGTGKTRVIAAIQARLAEVNSDASAVSRRVLLTSYQHDAVGNLIQATDDGRLPAVKLGRRTDQPDEAYLEAWALDLSGRLDKRYEDVQPHEYVRTQRALADRIAAYRLQPSDVLGTVRLLRWVAGRADVVGGDVARDATGLARRLERQLGSAPTTRVQAKAMRAARSLRTTAEAYADDGQITARNAYLTQEFFDLLNDGQRRGVDQAARGDGSPDELIQRLLAIRIDVLDRILDSRARATVVATMPEVEGLLQRAQANADAKVSLSVNPVELAIEEFRHAVIEQPAALRASLEAHTRALAATCQQAVSSRMRGVQTMPFDTVIVDEAARANPLDLMIPMTLATGRIVLVGDHRQLPQLLDDTLVPQLSKRHDGAAVETVLSRSLFERLFSKLRELEAHDGQKRVVTLDRQFRTHPVLGDFINQQFYAPYGEQVTNGNPDPLSFQHALNRYGSAACGWIDVPHARGRELRGNTISRPCEADTIVEELDLALEENPFLTFGVITFYKGQERAIWEAMRDLGLAVSGENGYELNPSVPRLRTDRGLPRVRIGTVDAFQGREFDVVFLSTTRSNRPHGSQGRAFGFLVLPNRLCVAMSRQRKLLIAVGDAEMFTLPESRDVVPSLGAFHDLTGGPHGFRRSA